MTKILIVDDEQDIVELLSYNLEREGFSTAKAYDGEAALKSVKTQTPAVADRRGYGKSRSHSESPWLRL
jgi:DNA-binding response OmpR family regulator